MKNLNYILILLLAVAIFYHLFFPNVVVDDQRVLIPGDTITTVINQKQFDSLTYHFKAEIERIKKTKTVYRVGKTDTLKDTTYIFYSTRFNLGDSTLGTSGKVIFDFSEFTFDSIQYRYPEKINSTIDTLKIIKTVAEPAEAFYLDEWFYSTLALFVLLLSSI
ncbi:MAG: hypothetical protein KKF62_01995 [Bacteroidetes bacterium]|nr:hypothetical protein [Bacteroidota bacterium]MBU1115336.1 hypothetical protein [Bacteroidota bacterium]MBU1799675.1 hypothetical protein [Bacteroidota bacterium]